MVNKCAIKDCKTTAIKGSKMHVIPKSDIGLLWIQAVQKFQHNFSPNPRTVICSSHFLNTDYTHSIIGEKLMLKKSAVPSVFNLKKLELAQCEDLVEEIELTLDDVPLTKSPRKCLFESTQSENVDEKFRTTMDNFPQTESSQIQLLSLELSEDSDSEVKESLPTT